jgi:hypothetical protein
MYSASMRPLPLGSQNGPAPISGRGLSSQRVVADEASHQGADPVDLFEASGASQVEWRPSGQPTSPRSSGLLINLRNSAARWALHVAMTASTIGPMLGPLSSYAQTTPQEPQKELFAPAEEGVSQDSRTYQMTAEDFATPGDTVKQKTVSPHGYEFDTRFAKISASPRFKDGELKTKVKSSAVRFSARKEWTRENGTQVSRGFTTRLRYEGEATYSGDEGFGFESKYLDAELGVEQRYHKTLQNEVHFVHRYFAGARYRYRFEDQQEGSELRAHLQAEQKAYKTDAVKLFGQNFGWEASARQTFVTQWGATENNGAEGIFEVDGALTKTVHVKLLGKEREVRLKAGPEVKYSTQDGFSVRPEFGAKIRL